MYDDKIDSIEEEKPELRLNLTVYLHAADHDEAIDRQRAIRHVVQEALADADNKLGTFTYPEVRLAWADKFGNPITPDQLFHGSVA